MNLPSKVNSTSTTRRAIAAFNLYPPRNQCLTAPSFLKLERLLSQLSYLSEASMQAAQNAMQKACRACKSIIMRHFSPMQSITSDKCCAARSHCPKLEPDEKLLPVLHLSAPLVNTCTILPNENGQANLKCLCNGTLHQMMHLPNQAFTCTPGFL